LNSINYFAISSNTGTVDTEVRLDIAIFHIIFVNYSASGVSL